MVPSLEWDEEVGVGWHTHRHKHAVEVETGWLGHTKEIVKMKYTNLLISQKRIAHTACFLCSLAWAGL